MIVACHIGRDLVVFFRCERSAESNSSYWLTWLQRLRIVWHLLIPLVVSMRRRLVMEGLLPYELSVCPCSGFFFRDLEERRPAAAVTRVPYYYCML